MYLISFVVGSNNQYVKVITLSKIHITRIVIDAPPEIKAAY